MSAAIFGLSSQSRCIAALHGETLGHRFVAATCSPTASPNEVFVLHFQDETNRVSCEHVWNIDNEVWKISPHPQVPSLMLFVTNAAKTNRFGVQLMDAPALRRLDAVEAGSSLPRADSDDDALLPVCDFGAHSGRIHDALWDPLGVSTQVLTLDSTALYSWTMESSASVKQRRKKEFTGFASLYSVDWDTHSADRVVVGATSAALGYDLRSDKYVFSSLL